jgi:hypothetical protein
MKYLFVNCRLIVLLINIAPLIFLTRLFRHGNEGVFIWSSFVLINLLFFVFVKPFYYRFHLGALLGDKMKVFHNSTEDFIESGRIFKKVRKPYALLVICQDRL